MLRPVKNCKKRTFLDNLRTVTQEGDMETRQMTPFFSFTFSALTVCMIFIFMYVPPPLPPPFAPFWSVKNLNFGENLPIQTAYYTFLESRHPKVTKNPYYVLSPEGSQKKYKLLVCQAFTISCKTFFLLMATVFKENLNL